MGGYQEQASCLRAFWFRNFNIRDEICFKYLIRETNTKKRTVLFHIIIQVITQLKVRPF